MEADDRWLTSRPLAEKYANHEDFDPHAAKRACVGGKTSAPIAQQQFKFPHKLYKLVSTSLDPAIGWTNDGNAIYLNYEHFTDERLSKLSLFKTGRVSSFVRQLNLYGFKKIGLPSITYEYTAIYSHPMFVRGKSYLLDEMVRAVPENRVRSKTVDENSSPKQMMQRFYKRPPAASGNVMLSEANVTKSVRTVTVGDANTTQYNLQGRNTLSSTSPTYNWYRIEQMRNQKLADVLEKVANEI